MHTYAMADEAGRILQVVNGPYRYIECDSDVMDNTHYADEAGEILEKQSLVLTVRTEGLTATIIGAPAGMKVETNGMEAITDEDPLAIEYDLPGTYMVTFSGLVEYLDHQMEVSVDDA